MGSIQQCGWSGDGSKTLVHSDGKEQMTQADGGEIIIALSASQSSHAGSISSAAPSLWSNSAITLSAEPPL